MAVQNKPAVTVHNKVDIDGNSLTTSTKAYTIPEDVQDRRRRPTTSMGRRGGSCISNENESFVLLGPDSQDKIIGKTTSTHPTFSWFLPNDDLDISVRFKLFELNEVNKLQLIHSHTMPYHPGIATYQIPETVPALSVNKEYYWRITVECHPSRPSRSLIQELAFEVVPVSPVLAQKLNAAETNSERALAYGSEGIWYDAIASVDETTNSEDKLMRSVLLTDLANILSNTSHITTTLDEDILRVLEAIDE